MLRRLKKLAVYGALASIPVIYHFCSKDAPLDVESDPAFKDLKAENDKLKADIRPLKDYKDHVTRKVEESFENEALSMPQGRLRLVEKPKPQREAYVSWGSGHYRGEAVRLELEDEEGRRYKLTVVNKDEMAQDNFIDGWMQLYKGGFDIRLLKEAKFHPRTMAEQANGAMPYPICGIFDKDDDGVNQCMEMFSDDPDFIRFVPWVPGDTHYPVSTFDHGLEMISRMQLDGTEKDKALARDFFNRHWDDLTQRQKENLNDIAGVTAEIRDDILQRMRQTYEDTLAESEMLLAPDSLD